MQINGSLDPLVSNSQSIPASMQRFPVSSSVVMERWSDWQREEFEEHVAVFRELGMKSETVHPVVFAERLENMSYLEVPTGVQDTRLLLGTNAELSWDGRYWGRVWMLKDDVPVAMLRFGSHPQDYIPGEGEEANEPLICDIEVRPCLRGRRYGLEVISWAENLVLGGRRIHSGGSYTPEGFRALGGKLPYRQLAREHKWKQEIDAGQVPKASWDSMSFVEDWDLFLPKGNDNY